MSYLSTIKRLYKNLKDGLRWAKIACRVAAHINAEIQNSAASDPVKAASAAFLESAEGLCALIQGDLTALDS